MLSVWKYNPIRDDMLCKKGSAEMGLFNRRKEAVTQPSIDDDLYGGFIISKNVLEKGRLIRYSYREEASIPELNGWKIYSDMDDDAYVSDPKNFSIVGATTMYGIASMMLEIFDAPYGTDLCWMYERDVLVGFYDLKRDRDTTIDEILSGC